MTVMMAKGERPRRRLLDGSCDAADHVGLDVAEPTDVLGYDTHTDDGDVANDAFGCDPNCRNHDAANGDGLCKSLDNVAAVVSMMMVSNPNH